MSVEQPKSTPPVKDADSGPTALSKKGAAGKRKQMDSAAREAPSNQKRALSSGNPPMGNTELSASHSAANGYSKGGLASGSKGKDKVEAGDPRPPLTKSQSAKGVSAVSDSKQAKGVPARPRSKKLRLLAKAAKAAAPARKLPTSAVLDSCHVSTSVAPPPRGDTHHLYWAATVYSVFTVHCMYCW